MRPTHLEPLARVLRRIMAGEHVRIVVHTPPRMGKTETLIHFMVWALMQRPEWSFVYGSYAQSIAWAKNQLAIDLADAAGLTLKKRAVSEWRLAGHRGGVIAAGVGGPLTGQGYEVGIVDDPNKDRLTAESPVYRERTWKWFQDVFFTRGAPTGSVIVNMARWHPDDLAGRCIRDLGWEYLQLPAINDAGESLWPERWPVERLREVEKVLGPFSWESLYQGNPRRRGESVFGDAHTYSTKPTVYRSAFGLDLAYTSKKSNDYSVAVEMRRQGSKFYVMNVARKQVKAPAFKAICFDLHREAPSAGWRWYAAGTELGAADFFTTSPDAVPVAAVPARGDKFTRAMAYAAAWNRGDVLVPEEAEWLPDFLTEHADFTGINDTHDDIIDGAVAAFDQLDDSIGDIDTQPRTPRKPGGLAGMSL